MFFISVDFNAAVLLQPKLHCYQKNVRLTRAPVCVVRTDNKICDEFFRTSHLFCADTHAEWKRKINAFCTVTDYKSNHFSPPLVAANKHRFSIAQQSTFSTLLHYVPMLIVDFGLLSNRPIFIVWLKWADITICTENGIFCNSLIKSLLP